MRDDVPHKIAMPKGEGQPSNFFVSRNPDERHAVHMSVNNPMYRHDEQTKAITEMTELQKGCDRPLPEAFRGQFGAPPGQLPLRAHLRTNLYRDLRASYPYLDHVMAYILVDHFLDHPDDEPGKLLQRAHRDAEGKVAVPTTSASANSQQQQQQDSGFNVEGPPGGRGVLKGTEDDDEEDEDEEEEQQLVEEEDKEAQDEEEEEQQQQQQRQQQKKKKKTRQSSEEDTDEAADGEEEQEEEEDDVDQQRASVKQEEPKSVRAEKGSEQDDGNETDDEDSS